MKKHFISIVLIMSLVTASAGAKDIAEYFASLPNQNFTEGTLRVLGAFEASSYGGWHGDGGSVTIYLIDPSGVDALIAGINRYYWTQKLQFPDEPDLIWGEGTRPDLSGLDDCIPEKYQPPKDTYRMEETPGRTRAIAIGKTSGYVSFGTNSY